MNTPFRRLRLLEFLTLVLAVCVFMAQKASPQALTQAPQSAEPQSNSATLSAPATAQRFATQPLVIPAGTLIVLRLDSPLNSESANKGSGVYAETVFPVIVDNHVVIPARTFVQGTVTSEKRGGHFSRRSAITMHFNNLVMGNTYSVTIDGALQSLPGAETQRADGSVTRTDQFDKALPPVAGGAVAGGVLGSVAHTGVGTWPGAAIGAGLGLGSVLIMRGGAVHLPEGQKLEMVLSAPVTVDAAQVKEASLHQSVGYANEHPRQQDENSPRLRRRPPPPMILPGMSPLSLLGLLLR